MKNWYVIQVRSGVEDKIIKSCQSRISETILEDCFVPYYKRVKKIRGSWDEVEEKLFPGYVFMISDDVSRLFIELKKIPDLTKLLGKHGTDIFPLNDDEIAFLSSFGKEEHIVDMSVGYIEGDKIIVNTGPLKGKEGLIVKVDRHKRIAFVDVEFLGQVTNAKVGLEIIKKNKNI